MVRVLGSRLLTATADTLGAAFLYFAWTPRLTALTQLMCRDRALLPSTLSLACPSGSLLSGFYGR